MSMPTTIPLKHLKVLVVYSSYPQELIDRVQETFGSALIVDCNNINDSNREETIAYMKEVDGFITAPQVKIDQLSLLQHAPKLRAISTVSVGYDNVTVADLTARGIAFMHTPTVLTDTVADTTLALMLASARRICELDQWVRAGLWKAPVTPPQFGRDVHHKTVGILGFGRIGKAVAQRCSMGFNMNVLYVSRNHGKSAVSDTSGYNYKARCVELPELLATSDFVVLCLPGSAETRHFISTKELEAMKKSAIIVNIGRGSVIDEEALIKALENNTIAGAGLDVYEKEPLAQSSRLNTLPNVVIVPHIGSATHETRFGMANCALDNLINALQNDISQNCVNKLDLQKNK
ncbi:gluconate 2-dehydrogenase [Cavenderia fasciculata]|uniref:Gluconate 2-dehydrogenase n=1 Tax=Cavenderia fasciculata TaxID=261658 RepID=F4Q8B4_CACFS|nr:gluconate 2-dehydrogenase [Cavenderia fasciculata]EGG16014.1 gluconate 2-dehydrogenase [Cavenderia fasciculata]|eukprot:XP_004352339.1 gluconate 2-dehydrogenase [Cavenderia fasciculata]